MSDTMRICSRRLPPEGSMHKPSVTGLYFTRQCHQAHSAENATLTSSLDLEISASSTTRTWQFAVTPWQFSFSAAFEFLSGHMHLTTGDQTSEAPRLLATITSEAKAPSVFNGSTSRLAMPRSAQLFPVLTFRGGKGQISYSSINVTPKTSLIAC